MTWRISLQYQICGARGPVRHVQAVPACAAPQYGRPLTGMSVGPLLGDACDAVFAGRHKGQRPSDVAGVLRIGAMAGGPATAGMGWGEGAGQQVVRDGEAAQELELALAKACRVEVLGVALYL